MMNPVMEAVAAGVLGTMAMDALNHLFSRAGIITRIDVGAIGRMAAGWTHGRFRYNHPTEMEEDSNETLYGYLTHYAIGVGFAFPYVVGWFFLVGGPVSPKWAIAYGLATTAASWFFVYPCMGFGAFGRNAPDGWKAILSPLANHFFYGLGLALGIALL